jgi:endonuclease G, mitochondrial
MEAARGIYKEVRIKGNNAWVITGPVFKEPGDKKQAVKTIGWSKVWVPQQFYKIIFYQSRDGSFNAIGFVFQNKKQLGDIRAYAVPVAEIEQMTGLTFLNKLPAEVGKLVKGSKPSVEKLEDFLSDEG